MRANTNTKNRADSTESVSLSSLASHKRWVFYTGEPGADGKLDKTPLRPRNGRRASYRNPKDWGTRAQAEAAAAEITAPGWRPGIGIVHGGLGNGLRLIGGDLDGALHRGKLEPWAEEICRMFDSCDEISPSGSGVKCFALISTADFESVQEEVGMITRESWNETGRAHYGFELHLGGYYAVTGRGYSLASKLIGDDLRVVTADDVLAIVAIAEARFGKKGRRGPRREKATDPTTKRGPVGDFCRVFDVPAAIDHFELPYEATDGWSASPRYTYTGGSTADGMVVYDNGLFAYSHHASDPARNQLVNAFDLVRLHKFDKLDKDASEALRATPHRLPSYVAMLDMLEGEPDYIVEREASAQADYENRTAFDGPEDDGRDDVREADFGAPIMRGNTIVPNITNAALSLVRGRDSILPGLRLNQMTGRDEWDGGEIDDAVLSLVRARLEQRGLETIGKDLTADAVAFVAHKFPYHPIREALARVAWDGVPRLDTWLARLATADDSPYVRTIGRKFIMQMIARVMDPGCKADHTMVLSGTQGQNKSTMLKILAGGEAYFSDNLPAINGSKDTMIHLRGKWLIELAELAPSRKSDATELKQFLSVPIDRYRPPYGKKEVAWPRQCVFAGTTNEDEFLNDDTGGRRFWPVYVKGVIDIDGVAAERDQLLAEALAAFNAGEAYWLSREFEAEHAKPVQEAARVSDTWHGAIADWLDAPVLSDAGDDIVRRSRVTLGEVLGEALNVASERQTPPVQRRAGAIMKALGWIKTHTRKGNLWERPE